MCSVKSSRSSTSQTICNQLMNSQVLKMKMKKSYEIQSSTIIRKMAFIPNPPTEVSLFWVRPSSSSSTTTTSCCCRRRIGIFVQKSGTDLFSTSTTALLLRNGYLTPLGHYGLLACGLPLADIVGKSFFKLGWNTLARRRKLTTV